MKGVKDGQGSVILVVCHNISVTLNEKGRPTFWVSKLKMWILLDVSPEANHWPSNDTASVQIGPESCCAVGSCASSSPTKGSLTKGLPWSCFMYLMDRWQWVFVRHGKTY